MRLACLTLVLASALPAVTRGDDSAPIPAPPAPAIAAPADVEPPPPAPPVPAAPADYPASPVVPYQPLPVTNSYSTYSTQPPGCNCGLRGTRYSLSSRAYPPAPADDGTTSYGPGMPYGVFVGPGVWGGGWMGAYTGAYASGTHDRYPYYSYRAPWYTPGPRSTNVTITW